MERSEGTSRASRRSFLQRILVFGGATGLLGLQGRGSAGPPVRPAPKDGDPVPTGYRLTPHIRRYYEKAGL